MFRKILLYFVCLFFLGTLVLAGGVYWSYLHVTRDLPNFSKIEDYKPPAVTKVFSTDGTLIAEFYKERRYPVKLSEIPQMIKNCFLASEDANFYSHPGIDPMSIARAVLKNFKSGHSTQGGSTITQQVVKNLLLSPEKNYERKIKEAILSYRLEKKLSKDGILEIYLNQIFFGNTAYGVKSAGLMYFHKNLDELTLAEGAYLAALPKAPSRYSPLLNKARAKRRQKYVLGQMVKASFITQAQADEASEEDVKVYLAPQKNIFYSPYFITELRNTFQNKWKDIDIDSDGLNIFMTVDLVADRMAMESLRKGLRVVDKRRGWRGPIDAIQSDAVATYLEKYKQRLEGISESSLFVNTVYPALVTNINKVNGILTYLVGSIKGQLELKDIQWARKFLNKNDRTASIRLEDAIRVGDIIEVAIRDPKLKVGTEKDPPNTENLFSKVPASIDLLSLNKSKSNKEEIYTDFQLDQTPEIEGALSLIDPYSGKVRALAGGYDYARSQFNRVTQSLRQPGSAFKPIVYLSAVDGFKYTPSTIVYDTPRTFKAGDEYWTPQNFDNKYLGAIPLQVALERSRNLVSADIVSKIGIKAPIDYARRLGITSPMGKNLSISLGSSEVTMIELVRAYGVFPARGVLFDTSYVEKIFDRNGIALYDYEADKISHARQAIDEKSAFIMAHMMRGVVERGTATIVKDLKRPTAGKTGTTNNQMDTWFIGYTPKWVSGVWVGFDLKKEIGEKETGGKVAAPIFLDFMKSFLDYDETKEYDFLIKDTKAESEKLGIKYIPPAKPLPSDFTVPEGVDPYYVNKSTGRITSKDSPGAILEYFVRGTEPKNRESDSGEEDSDSSIESYLDSPDL